MTKKKDKNKKIVIRTIIAATALCLAFSLLSNNIFQIPWYSILLCYLAAYIFSDNWPGSPITRWIQWFGNLILANNVFILGLSNTLVYLVYLAIATGAITYKIVPLIFPAANAYLLLFTFITLTFTLASVASNFFLKQLNSLLSTGKESEENRDNNHMMPDILNNNRIRFIIYSLYAVFILYYAILHLSDSQAFDPKLFETIMYSFMLYLALDQVFTNFHLLKTKTALCAITRPPQVKKG